MANLKFLGAAGTVTGSRFLLETNKNKFLVDCGLFQGPKKFRLLNWEPFQVDPKSISDILLTHAHIDHSGYLPKLVKEGFKGKIFSTHATKDLCEIMLADSAHLQEEDAYWANKKGYSKHKPALPLYTKVDAENTMKQFKSYHYGEEFFINDELRVKFRDAGHILGSSFVDIKNRARGKKILFSGDFGRPDRPALSEPDQVYNVDYLVLESTYGDRTHEQDNPLGELARVINDSYKRRGVLVIPAFSIGRTQTLLFAIRELEEAGEIPVMPIYADSPMAIKATGVFEDRIRNFNIFSRKLSLRGKQIFRPQNIHFCTKKEESMAINQVAEKAIIISASGMATGGRILHHLAYRLPERKNTILFIGHQAMGTRGRSILEGNKEVKIHGRQVPVRARVESISGYSAHGDYEEMLAWLMAFNKPPTKTFLVHGDPEASQALAEKIRDTYQWDVEIPKMSQSFEIDI